MKLFKDIKSQLLECNKTAGGTSVVELVADVVRDSIRGDITTFILSDYVHQLEYLLASMVEYSEDNKKDYEKQYASYVNEVKDLKLTLHLEEKVNDGILRDAAEIQKGLEDKISEKDKEISVLKAWKQKSDVASEYADAEIRDLKAKISDLAEDVSTEKFKVGECESLISTLRTRVSDLNKRIVDLEEGYATVLEENIFLVEQSEVLENEVKRLHDVSKQLSADFTDQFDKKIAAIAKSDSLSVENESLRKALLVWVEKFVAKDRAYIHLHEAHVRLDEGRRSEVAVERERTKYHLERSNALEKDRDDFAALLEKQKGITEKHFDRADAAEKDRDAWKGRAEKLKADCENVSKELKGVKDKPGGYWFILNRGAEFVLPENFDKDPIEAMAYLIAHKIQYHRLMDENFKLRGIPPLNDLDLKKRCEEEAINNYKQLKRFVAQLDDKYKDKFWPGSTIEKCDPPSVVISDSAHGLFFVGETLEEAKNHNKVGTSLEERKAIVRKRANPVASPELCVDSPFYDMEDVGAPYSDEMKRVEKEELAKIEKQFEDPFLITPCAGLMPEIQPLSSMRMGAGDWDKLQNPDKLEIIKEDLEKAEARKVASQSVVQFVKDKIEEEKFIRRNTFIDSMPSIFHATLPEDVKIQYTYEPVCASLALPVDRIKIVD